MMICSAGNDNASIMRHLANGDIRLSSTKSIKEKSKDFGDKDFMLGVCEHLAPLPRETPTRFCSRTNTILYNALLNGQNLIKEILESCEKIAIIIGTTTTAIEENYQRIAKNKYLQDFSALDNPACFVRNLYHIVGLSLGISSACTSGAKAIIEGARLIKSNLCEAVICGGVDSLNTLTINGFDSLNILSPKQSRAYASDREGINIGEGAGVFVLVDSKIVEAKPHLASDFRVELKGYASNNDAFHITQPREDFAMQELLLQDALKCANLSPTDIDYINLHGTGTKANDEMEANTFAYALQGGLKSIPASSIKPFIGHTLGAAGAIEAGVCAELVLQSLGGGSAKNESAKSNLVPHIYEFDKNLPKITLAQKGDSTKVRNALSVSFAFGGDNSAIIVGQA